MADPYGIEAAGNGVLLNEQASLLRKCRAALDALIEQEPGMQGLLCGDTTLGCLRAELYDYRPAGVFGGDAAHPLTHALDPEGEI